MLQHDVTAQRGEKSDKRSASEAWRASRTRRSGRRRPTDQPGVRKIPDDRRGAAPGRFGRSFGLSGRQSV